MSKGLFTKEKIIARSAELFNLYGYHRCSLQDIMEATNLKKGGIYNHFRNKDEIAVAAFDYSSDLVFKRFREKLAECTSASEKLDAILRTFEENVENPIFKGGCPIINTAIDTTDTYPVLREKAKAALNKLETYISIKLSDGIKNGEFKKNIVAEEVAAFIVSSFEGAIIVSRLNSNNKYMKFTLVNIRNYIEREIKN
ncbi:MAG TPA: TetR/AcrR family transcriptional regulator [Cytophagales bacterium]|nr:TetR/AcrR family transcriptional regulator [Cytophagales bacterium]